jgi:hypothetical protein
MTSIKKPFIAIASAVALVATALIASPASAASFAVSGGDYSSKNGSTVALATSIPVPADNKVDAADVLTIALTSVATGSDVVVEATNAKVVTALHTTAAPVTASASSVTKVSTGTGTAVTLYVFTTATSVGTVRVTADGTTNTYYVKGTAGPAYNVAVTTSAVAGLNADVKLAVTATDVFGNTVENAVATATVLRGVVKTQPTWSSTTKVYEGVVTTPATAGDVNGIVKISATAVDGLPKPVDEVSFKIGVADLADALALANAKIAELEAKLAAAEKQATTNKVKHNNLAKKWNKKFPKSKVKLLK